MALFGDSHASWDEIQYPNGSPTGQGQSLLTLPVLAYWNRRFNPLDALSHCNSSVRVPWALAVRASLIRGTVIPVFYRC
ncbi:hypothetical protein CRV24_007798 [Beauveria bassiana]|nr:hypothetical protein CRV24_007798 [Beauveria bassiana]